MFEYIFGIDIAMAPLLLQGCFWAHFWKPCQSLLLSTIVLNDIAICTYTYVYNVFSLSEFCTNI